MSGRSNYDISSDGTGSSYFGMIRRENNNLHESAAPPIANLFSPTFPSPHPLITQHEGQAIGDLLPAFCYDHRLGQPVFPFRRIPTSTHSNVQVFELGYDLARRPPRLPLPLSPHFESFIRNDPVVPIDSSDESKLIQDKQEKALSMLRKETYNPLLNKTTSSSRSDYQVRDWAILSRQTELGKDNEHRKRCTICLEDFKIKEIVTLTPCNHMFHDDCIVPWVKTHGKCPVCRYAFINPEREKRERPAAGLPREVDNSPTDNYATTALGRGRPIYAMSGYGFAPRSSLTFMLGHNNDRLFERRMISLVRAMGSASEWDVVRPSLN